MKNASRIGLLSLALLLGASASIDAAQQKKKQSFFQKHKRKLIAGAAAAATIGIAVALGLHTDKTMTAIQDAEIRPGDPQFKTAVAAVAFLGPLGIEKTIWLQNQVIEQFPDQRENIKAFVRGESGKALAQYWNVTHSAYSNNSGFGTIVSRLQRGAELLEEGVEDVAGAAGRGFNAIRGRARRAGLG